MSVVTFGRALVETIMAVTQRQGAAEPVFRGVCVVLLDQLSQMEPGSLAAAPMMVVALRKEHAEEF